MQQVIEQLNGWNALYHAQQATTSALEERVSILRAELQREETRLQEAKAARDQLTEIRTNDLIGTLSELAEALLKKSEALTKREEQKHLFEDERIAGEDELIQVYESSATSFVHEPLQERYETALAHRKTREDLTALLSSTVPAGFVFIPSTPETFDVYTTVLFDKQDTPIARALTAHLGEIILAEAADFQERNEQGLLVVTITGAYEKIFDATRANISSLEQEGIEYVVVDGSITSQKKESASASDFFPIRISSAITGVQVSALNGHIDAHGGSIVSRMREGRREVSLASLLDFVEQKYGTRKVYTLSEAAARVVVEEEKHGKTSLQEDIHHELTELKDRGFLCFLNVNGTEIIGEPELLRVWTEYAVSQQMDTAAPHLTYDETAALFRKPLSFVERQLRKGKFTGSKEYVSKESIVAFLAAHSYGSNGRWTPRVIKGGADEQD